MAQHFRLVNSFNLPRDPLGPSRSVDPRSLLPGSLGHGAAWWNPGDRCAVLRLWTGPGTGWNYPGRGAQWSPVVLRRGEALGEWNTFGNWKSLVYIYIYLYIYIFICICIYVYHNHNIYIYMHKWRLESEISNWTSWHRKVMEHHWTSSH